MDALAKTFQLDVMHVISNTSIFSGVGILEQKMLADKFTLVESNADEIIIEQGEVGDRLYVIIKGQILVSIKTNSMGWKKINNLGPGDVFGEIAILRNIPRTARISTLTPCQFLTINAKDFLAVYQYFPAKARDNIQLVVAKRLQELGYYAHL